MNWIPLTDTTQLHKIINDNKKQDALLQTVLLFKHSTRCSISSMALNRLQTKWLADQTNHITPYLLDLLNYRDVSNEIASLLNVEHASPQVLIIQNGKCVYHSSHNGIVYTDILEATTK